MKNFFSDFFENKLKLSFALILLPLLLYKKALFFDFSPMDEQWLIEENASFLGKWGSIKTAFKEPSAFIFYRPLFMTSLIFDYHMGKLDPFYYNFSNLLFHLANVLLVFHFLTTFDVSRKVAFGLALIFAVHPVMLHAVAWVPGRNDSLLCIFSLSSLIFLSRYLSENKNRWLAWHLMFFVLALLTKESAVILPLIFFLLYYFKEKGTIKKTAAVSVVWIFITVTWFVLRKSVVSYIPGMENDLVATGKNAIFAFLVFLGKTIFPVQQSVFPTLENSSVLPGILTLLVFMLLWFTCTPENKSIALLGIIIFFGFLALPVYFGVMKSPGEQYEHRIYTSMAGLLLFLSQLEFKLSSKILTALLVVLLGVLSAKTLVRMNVYKDKFSFLDAGIKESPGYYYFHLAKGDLLYKNKDYANALESFDKAIALNPARPQSYNNRANVYIALGKNKEAIADYTKALDKTGTNATVLMQRCIAYYQSGDIEMAMKDLSVLKKCCQSQVHPDMEKTLNEAWEIETWSRKVPSDPKNATLYIERAKFFMEKRKGNEALADLQKACELEPSNKMYKEYLRQLSTSFPH